MADSTVCPKCTLEFNANVRIPRLLPCGHTLCNACVETIQLIPKDSSSCPVCGTEYRANQEEDFPVNEDVLRTLDPVNECGATAGDPATCDDGEDKQNGQTQPQTTAQRVFRATGLAVAGVIGAGAALVAAPAVLGAVGFSRSGVAAGSIAASWMALSGPIKAGSLYATLQSTGAAGLGLAGKTLVAGVGSAAGSGLAYIGEKFKDQKSPIPKDGRGNDASEDANKDGTSVDSPKVVNVKVVSDYGKHAQETNNSEHEQTVNKLPVTYR